MEYALERTHPGGKSMLSKYLMLLPKLRELSAYNNQSLQAAQNHLKPDLSPLLIEALSGTCIESPTDNELQQYDNGSGEPPQPRLS